MPQKIATGLEFRIKKEEGLYEAKSKALNSCSTTAQLIGAFVFAYAKSRVFFMTRHKCGQNDSFK